MWLAPAAGTFPRPLKFLPGDCMSLLCLLALPDGRLLAGDELGRLHWLKVLDDLHAGSVTPSLPQNAQPLLPDAGGKRQSWLGRWRLWDRRQDK